MSHEKEHKQRDGISSDVVNIVPCEFHHLMTIPKIDRDDDRYAFADSTQVEFTTVEECFQCSCNSLAMKTPGPYR